MTLQARLDDIQKAVTEHQRRLNEDIYIDGVPRWKAMNFQRRVAAAANNYNGFIVVGARHFCPAMSMQLDAIGDDVLTAWCGGRLEGEQGFIDQFGDFMSREEAWKVAAGAMQIIHDVGCAGTLFSENIV